MGGVWHGVGEVGKGEQNRVVNQLAWARTISRHMSTQTSYSHARANLAKILDQVGEDRQTVVIHRRGREDVALIAAAELAGLAETAHLLRSPRNAARLLKALREAKAGKGARLTAQQLRERVGLEAKE